jgi:hypothetical protein
MDEEFRRSKRPMEDELNEEKRGKKMRLEKNLEINRQQKQNL